MYTFGKSIGTENFFGLNFFLVKVQECYVNVIHRSEDKDCELHVIENGLELYFFNKYKFYLT